METSHNSELITLAKQTASLIEQLAQRGRQISEQHQQAAQQLSQTVTQTQSSVQRMLREARTQLAEQSHAVLKEALNGQIVQFEQRLSQTTLQLQRAGEGEFYSIHKTLNRF